MKTITLIGVTAGALALAGCYGQMDKETPVTKAPAAKVVGKPRSCIPINQISNSRVHDDYTIDFKLGSQTYRNTLPHKCSGLGFEKAFTYETSLSNLCNTDVIYVLRNIGGKLERGPGCGLGQFVPVEIEKKKS